MSELCHKNFTCMYLFFGLLLFTSLCKHFGELSSSSRQVSNHPIDRYMYSLQGITRVLCKYRQARQTDCLIPFLLWVKSSNQSAWLGCVYTVLWWCRDGLFVWRTRGRDSERGGGDRPVTSPPALAGAESAQRGAGSGLTTGGAGCHMHVAYGIRIQVRHLLAWLRTRACMVFDSLIGGYTQSDL